MPPPYPGQVTANDVKESVASIASPGLMSSFARYCPSRCKSLLGRTKVEGRTAPAMSLRLLTLAILFGMAFPLGVRAFESRPLKLVHADEFSIVFMRDFGAATPERADPYEVETIAFFEKPDLLGQISEWDTRISTTRVNCATGVLGDIRHRIFLGAELVDETSPPFAMRAPNGPEKAAVLNSACRTEKSQGSVVASDINAARQWAVEAYRGMNVSQGASRRGSSAASDRQ